MKFTEIFKKNNELATILEYSRIYPIAILSNIIVNQLKPTLEFTLRSKKVNAECTIGDYDNIVQDSLKYKKHNIVIVFWEAANLIDGFQYRSNLFTEEDVQIYLSRFKRDIDFVIANLAATPLVIFNKFSSIAFNHHYLSQNIFDKFCDELNSHLKSLLKSNMVLIDTEKIIVKNGIERSVDFRNYYSSKALYTFDFFKSYVEHIKHLVFSLEGKAKKVLIFDCDNTLWSGIIGEDGMEGIHMNSTNNKGVVFEEIQFIAKELASKGVIIGLNSKNNAEEVEEVIMNHKEMQLSDDEIVIKAVNWNNKADNLIEIAKKLNIGIDSIVFVDDSDFEINLVNDLLPEITTIQVPINNNYLYPDEIRKYLNLFYSHSFSKEDLTRSKMYKEDQQRKNNKEDFNNIEEYLKTLMLEVKIYLNSIEFIPRMAQLTQKTNQFNLTTKRYSESQISTFVKSSTYLTFAFDIKDKFGDFGITGLSIVKIKGKEAEIDTLLLSCRILGRNLEMKFASELILYLKIQGIKRIHAYYKKTLKNEQVVNYFESIGFILINENENEKKYILEINGYIEQTINYIGVNYG